MTDMKRPEETAAHSRDVAQRRYGNPMKGPQGAVTAKNLPWWSNRASANSDQGTRASDGPMKLFNTGKMKLFKT